MLIIELHNARLFIAFTKSAIEQTTRKKLSNNQKQKFHGKKLNI